MRKIIYLLTISHLILFFQIRCSNPNAQKNQELKDSLPEIQSGAEKLSVQTIEKEHPGKAVYMEYCASCHQDNGEGVPTLHPPLTPGSWVEKEPKELVALMMKGLSGKIEVNGETYLEFMPSQANLTDQEIADVLSYIRSSFGNNLSPVYVGLVSKIRSGKSQ